MKKPNRHKANRQSRRDANERRSKARADHALDFYSSIDRAFPRTVNKRPSIRRSNASPYGWLMAFDLKRDDFETGFIR